MRGMLVKLIVDRYKHAAKIHFGTNARRAVDGGAAEQIAVLGKNAKLAGTRIKSCNTVAPPLAFLRFLPVNKKLEQCEGVAAHIDARRTPGVSDQEFRIVAIAVSGRS